MNDKEGGRGSEKKERRRRRQREVSLYNVFLPHFPLASPSTDVGEKRSEKGSNRRKRLTGLPLSIFLRLFL